MRLKTITEIRTAELKRVKKAAQLAAVFELAGQGKTRAEIIEFVGISPKTLGRLMRMHGIVITRDSLLQRTPQETMDRMALMDAQGISLRQIAEYFHMRSDRVTLILAASKKARIERAARELESIEPEPQVVTPTRTHCNGTQRGAYTGPAWNIRDGAAAEVQSFGTRC
jgi:hypothetical protein